MLCCSLHDLCLRGIARGVAWMLENPERTALATLPSIHALLAQRLSPLMVKWCLVCIGAVLLILQHLLGFQAIISCVPVLHACCHRCMGALGGWSCKPQLGLGNPCLGQSVVGFIHHDNHVVVDVLGSSVLLGLSSPSKVSTSLQ